MGADIFVSDLTAAAGGFEFNLNYDASRLPCCVFAADLELKIGEALDPSTVAFGFNLVNAGAGGNFNVLPATSIRPTRRSLRPCWERVSG